MKVPLNKPLKAGFFLLAFLVFYEASAQQFLTKISGWNAYVHLPDDYELSPSSKYPLIVFWPGVGEVGTDASKLLVNGPSKFIKDGWNGHVTVNGKVEKPIIISVQPATAWPALSIINVKLDSIVKRWRVDEDRIYFTGLSHGGWITNCMVSQSEPMSKRLAANVAMSAVLPMYPYSDFRWFALNGGESWQFEGDSDLRGNHKITDTMNAYVPGSGRYTLYKGGHCCWNTYYNPEWRENGESIYEWMLKHSRSTESQKPVNTAPVANAGADITITLPTNSVTLKGSGTDADGSITSYKWTKVTALAATIASPSSANTNVTALVEGTHTFRLTVTDNAGATASDDVTVVVKAAPVPEPPANDPPANQPPASNPPANNPPASNNPPANNNCNGRRVKLTPGPYYIDLTGKVNPGDTLVISAGSYGFIELKGVIGTESCPITIINEGGQAVFEAFNFGFPCRYVHMTGTGALGVPYGFKMMNKNTKYWGMHLKCEGPFEVDHVEITNCAMGIQLKDDNAPAELVEHRNFVFHNLYIHDINGNEGMYIGSSTTPTAPKVKGVHIYDVLIENTSREGLQISNAQNVLVERVKIFQPSLKNENSQNHSFNMGHDVQGVARNMYIQSSPSYNVFLSGGRISFECSTIDHSFSIFPRTDALFGKNYEFNSATWVETYQQFNIQDIWLKNAGGVNIASIASEGPLKPNTVKNIKIDGGATNPMNFGPNAAVSNVGANVVFSAGCTPPNYDTKWTLDWPASSPADGSNQPINVNPVANAGPDKTITLPTNSVTLNGSGTDSDGTVVSYKWIKAAGPSSFTFSNANAATTTVSGLVEGVYTFELTVTDDKGATSKDAVTVTVNAAPNQAPVANAGTDQIITLPVNSVTLNGSGTDSDGNITSYRWTKTSGPASFTIVSPNSATTLVSGLAEGVYTFELTVTDNRGATGKATVKVTVNPAAPAPEAPNQAPVANAGANQTITLPVNSVTLTGSGTDNDGTIVSYKWAKTAGPSSFTFSNANAATTTVSGLVEGVYTFELTVTDNKGATGKATMNVTVNKAPNKAPVANAGADKTVTAPVTEVELDGSASYDPDGTIVKYEWIKISGDNPFTIFQSNTAKPTISNLPEGEYVLELTVTDNEGATAKDQVKVTVLAPPPVVQPDPVLKAEAGVSQTVMLPNTTTLLDGSASQGKITQILWRQISGPSVALMGSPTKLTTPVSNLIAGDYVFELTVKNDKGQTDVASVTVSVVHNNLRYSESIEIYPNPVQSILNYRFFTDEIKERLVLSLMDLNGKKVINDITIYKETTLYSGQMNLGFLQSGIYILEIRKEDGTRIVKKILKD